MQLLDGLGCDLTYMEEPRGCHPTSIQSRLLAISCNQSTNQPISQSIN